MPEPGAYAGLLAGAALAAFVGMGWLALAMPVHAAQAWGQAPPASRRAPLRWLGSAGLLVALWLCLRADHPTMAVLVWAMLLAAAALAIALLLAHRPHWLRVLAPGLRPSPGSKRKTSSG